MTELDYCVLAVLDNSGLLSFDELVERLQRDFGYSDFFESLRESLDSLRLLGLVKSENRFDFSYGYELIESYRVSRRCYYWSS